VPRAMGESGMTEALVRLREAVANRNEGPTLTPFVGAGFSSAATSGAEHASWSGLLLDGIKVCERLCVPTPSGWSERMKEQLDNADTITYLAVADEVTRRLSAVRQGQEFGFWLRRTVGGLRPSKEGRTAIKAVCKLGDFIVTTNYDNLIEMATGWKSCTWSDKYYAATLSKPQVVVHLHGVVDNPESIILSSAHYERLSTNEPTQIFHQTLFASRRFIFIGCGDGLGDPDISTLMEFAHRAEPETEHYLLVTGKQLRRLNRHPISPQVTPVAYGSDFADLTPFLVKLAAGQPIAVSQDPGYYDRKDPMAVLGLASTAWEQLQAAGEALRRAQRAMDQVDNLGTVPDGMDRWDYRDRAAVHEQLAAAIRGPAVRLESAVVQVVGLVQEAERHAGRLTAQQFDRFAADLRMMTDEVAGLESALWQLRGSVLRRRDDLEVRADLSDGYRVQAGTLAHAFESIDVAHDTVHSIKEGLDELRADRLPEPPPAAPLAAGRETARPGPAGAGRADLRAVPDTVSPGPGEATEPDPAFFPDEVAAEQGEATRLRFRSVPVLADIQAGDFTLADPENIEDYQALPAQHVRGEPLFLQKVRGDSMAGEDGVHSGDYVVVRQQQAWDNGDMVVVVDPGEGAVLKRIWRRDNGSIVLQPSNPNYPPLELQPGTEPAVLGKVIAVVRWQIRKGRPPGPPG
jgi:SOS-response transcriptional repressor LexA